MPLNLCYLTVGLGASLITTTEKIVDSFLYLFLNACIGGGGWDKILTFSLLVRTATRTQKRPPTQERMSQQILFFPSEKTGPRKTDCFL